MILLSLWSCFILGRADASEWEKTDYIWNFGIISSCDRGLIKSPEEYFRKNANFNLKAYQGIKKGDVVWVKAQHMSIFCNKILPKVKDPFVLVISAGVESFPSECENFNIEALLSKKKIIHVFAQNCDYSGSSKKVTHLPLGIDFHTMAYKNEKHGEKALPLEQEAELKDLLETAQSTHLRKKLAFVDFQHNDTIRYGSMQRYLKLGEDRTTIFEYLKTTGLIDYSDPLKRIDLWRKKIEYAFSISPHGNGLDCHRTWEDLLLGCIVIVKTSSLDPLYEGLPVVIVQDWSELTEENFDYWIEKYRDAFDNPAYREKLSYLYWWNRIQEKAQPFK